MSSSGYLVPPDQRDQRADDQQKVMQAALWDETWVRLERFLPSLMPELFPEEVEKERERRRAARRGSKEVVREKERG